MGRRNSKSQVLVTSLKNSVVLEYTVHMSQQVDKENPDL
jgi:hypothetical protein